jgi:hypothetical protein
MLGTGLKKTLEAGAEIGSTADVRFGVGIGAIEGEDSCGLGESGERGLRLGGVEGGGIEINRHCCLP